MLHVTVFPAIFAKGEEVSRVTVFAAIGRGEVSHVTMSADITGEREGITCKGVCWDFSGGGRVSHITRVAGISAETSHM